MSKICILKRGHASPHAYAHADLNDRICGHEKDEGMTIEELLDAYRDRINDSWESSIERGQASPEEEAAIFDTRNEIVERVLLLTVGQNQIAKLEADLDDRDNDVIRLTRERDSLREELQYAVDYGYQRDRVVRALREGK